MNLSRERFFSGLDLGRDQAPGRGEAWEEAVRMFFLLAYLSVCLSIYLSACLPACCDMAVV